MKVSGNETNKKDVIRVYKNQCSFFGILPISEIKIAEMSAHELYHKCQKDYYKQPEYLKKRWLKHLKLYDGFWTRLRKRFFQKRV